MIAITGATGQLGRLVVLQLLKTVPAEKLVAIVRNPSKASDLASMGVVVRSAAYGDRPALESAFAGVERVLLVSSNDVGQRVHQHRNAIEAAKAARVKLLAYTSVLHADRSTLELAKEHIETEGLLAASGLPHVLLRNGWYTENYTGSIPVALANGTFIGSAGNGRISSASRQDYAEAAAAVLTGPVEPGKVHELAGDESYTLAELAAEVSRQTGTLLAYRDLPAAEYSALLVKGGLPAPFAELLASSDASAAGGALFDDSRTLSKLIGRATTPMRETVKEALEA